jgi:hypothetical protein
MCACTGGNQDLIRAVCWVPCCLANRRQRWPPASTYIRQTGVRGWYLHIPTCWGLEICGGAAPPATAGLTEAAGVGGASSWKATAASSVNPWIRLGEGVGSPCSERWHGLSTYSATRPNCTTANPRVSVQHLVQEGLHTSLAQMHFPPPGTSPLTAVDKVLEGGHISKKLAQKTGVKLVFLLVKSRTRAFQQTAAPEWSLV